MNDLRELSINVTYKNIEKNLTEKAVNIVKDKIKKGFSDVVKKFKRSGISISRVTNEENSVFPLALGVYVKSK